jgi:hypothetical protein
MASQHVDPRRSVFFDLDQIVLTGRAYQRRSMPPHGHVWSCAIAGGRHEQDDSNRGFRFAAHRFGRRRA